MRRTVLILLLIGPLGCGSDGAVGIGGGGDAGDVDTFWVDDLVDSAPDAAVEAGDDETALTTPDVATDEPDGSDSGPGEADTRDVAAEDGLTAFERCFRNVLPEDDEPVPDYDQFGPVVGAHCHGTNHQDIRDVERVVFLGDSVTVGTPPTRDDQFYRSILADALVERFDLEAPGFLWKGVHWGNGTAWEQESGDFASCAEWGARTDDLLLGGEQIASCFPPETLDQRTLVIMTMGGNDLAAITEGFVDGKTVEQLWEDTHQFMALMRDGVDWLVEPGRFSNGVYVVFTNLYEYTDATGDVTVCPAAALGGLTEDIDDPELPEMVIWAMEEFMSIAVDTGTDMLFLLESFCGHGFNREDPNGRCYLGEDAESWFDMTCIHPNPAGHAQIAEMFLSVVEQ